MLERLGVLCKVEGCSATHVLANGPVDSAVKPHPRIRKTMKWAGAGVCVVLVVAWIGSGWWSISWVDPGGHIGTLDEGRMTMWSGDSVKGLLTNRYEVQSSILKLALHQEAMMRREHHPAYDAGLIWSQLRREQAQGDLAALQKRWRIRHHPRMWSLVFEWNQGSGALHVSIPLWVSALGAIFPTAAAWRLDTLARRARVGNCPKCDYDRRGLAVASVCPECGAAVIDLSQGPKPSALLANNPE